MTTTVTLDSLKSSDTALPNIVQSLSNQVLADESKADDLVWETWNSLFAVVAKTPREEQGRLVNFVDLLRKSPVKNAAGQEVTVEGGALWADLPTFGWVARDLWNWGKMTSPLRSPQSTGA